MINDNDRQKFKQLVEAAEHITVVQAENPDGDSLGSALALESVLSELGKKVSLFCAVEIPKHLRYIAGWDRVTDEKPEQTDLIIVVDISNESLLEKASEIIPIKESELIVIDHHGTVSSMDATLLINEPDAAATSQLLFELFEANEWSVNKSAAESMLASTLADTLGLSLPSVNHHVLRFITKLHELHPELRIADIELRRRKQNRKDLEIIKYKGELLQRIEYFFDGQLAIVVIPLEEIKQYSDKYNPSVLVLEELRMAKKVKVGLSFKVYDNRITGKLREVNEGGEICDQIALEFGGGGHPGSAGFKVDSTDIDAIKKRAVVTTGKLLNP